MKVYYISFVLLALALMCALVYNLIGVDIAPDGTLLEPFFLIGLGYIFAFLGFFLALIKTIILFIHRKK